MGTMSCNRCFFWVFTSGSVSGECHRNSPRFIKGLVVGQATNPFDAVWPITSSGAWCGSFQDIDDPWSRQMFQSLPVQ